MDEQEEVDAAPVDRVVMPRRIAEHHPPPHAQFVVRRNGRYFTATPCYGLHEPWWVVRTMPDSWPNEAEPEPMNGNDEWWPLNEFRPAA